MNYPLAPWTRERNGRNGVDIVRDSTSCKIAEVSHFLLDAQDANASLIVAAPDILETLEDLIAQLRGMESGHLRPYMAECRKAIAKAKGIV